MAQALIHRYDNEADILAVEEKGFSDVYRRAATDDFEIVVVVPTGAAETQTSVVADAISEQYTPNTMGRWPGRPDRYPVRVNVEHVRYTTRERVKHAVIDSGQTWAAQWTVINTELDESLLLPPESGSPQAESSQVNPSGP
jgi:hypothetical protein